jgi:AmiR/NasT family two-component response regulator
MLNTEDLKLGQALAHAASIALVVHQTAAEQATVNAQLQTALNSRVILEQAKGVVSASGQLDMNQAFDALRRYSRNHNQKLTSLAQAVVDRTIPAHLVLEQGPRQSRSRPAISVE